MNQIGDEPPSEGGTIASLRALTALKTVYLADNPVVKSLAATNEQGYHLYLKQQVPSLEQIDGYMVQQLFRMKAKPAQVEGITKKEIDPQAKAMIQDVLMKNA